MPDFQLPDTPTSSPFGYPLARRQDGFRRLVSDATETSRVTFRGASTPLKIIRVPLNLPKYRLANGRTTSAQEEYIAINGKPDDFFSADPELLEAQKAQHDLLLPLAQKADLLSFFEDPAKRQDTPLILDEKGFVINGNRRLAGWRSLYSKDAQKYGHFAYVDVVVLPYCDEKELDKLEASLQMERPSEAKYSWDTTANMMLQKRKAYGYTDRELAELYGMKESEVRELIDMRDYAAEYLRSRSKENHWSMVSEDKYAFEKLVAGRFKLATPGEQELFKEAAFILIDNADAVGRRLYEVIPGVQQYLGTIKEKLQERFQVTPPQDTTGLEQYFGGVVAPDAIEIALASEVKKPENADEARAIIVEVIESQDQLKKDSRTANYLLRTLAEANSKLNAAVSQGLRPETKKAGVEAQLVELERKIAQIRQWLIANA
jgi:hypothetical protein